MKKFPYFKVEIKKNNKQEIMKESKIAILALLIIGLILWLHLI